MKKRQMRMGMFDHAKYSRPVIRGMPDELLQDVRKEIRTLLNGPEVATSSRKRSHEDANATNGDEEEGEAEDNGDNTPPTHQRINILVPTPGESTARPRAAVGFGSVASMMAAQRQGRDTTKKAAAASSMVNPTLSQVRAAMLGPDRRVENYNRKPQQPVMNEGDPLPPRLMEYCRQNGRMIGLGAGGRAETKEQQRERQQQQQPNDDVPFTPSTPGNSSELLCTPPQRNRHQEQQMRQQANQRGGAKGNNQQEQQQQGQESGHIFPSKPPLKEIAAKLMESCPRITLRPDEPMTLADATFSLVRRALDAAKERSKNAQRDNQGAAAAGCSSSGTGLLEENSAFEHSPYRTIADRTLFIEDQLEEEANANRTDRRGWGQQQNNSNLMTPNQQQPYLDESPLADLEDDYLTYQPSAADCEPAPGSVLGSASAFLSGCRFDAGFSSFRSSTIPNASMGMGTFGNNNNYEQEDEAAACTPPRRDDSVFAQLMGGPSTTPIAGGRVNNSSNHSLLEFNRSLMRSRRFGFDFDGAGSQFGDNNSGGGGAGGHQLLEQQSGSSRQMLQGLGLGGNGSQMGGFLGESSFNPFGNNDGQQQQKNRTAAAPSTSANNNNNMMVDDNADYGMEEDVGNFKFF